jgi:hypothetical protein
LCETYPVQEETQGADDASLAVAGRELDANRQAWQRFIDEKLIEWGRDPSLLDDESVIPPSRPSVDTAVWLAMRLRDAGEVPPLRVVPDGDGGIVFERWEGNLSESFEVSQHGGIEYVQCRDGRVEARRAVQ